MLVLRLEALARRPPRLLRFATICRWALLAGYRWRPVLTHRTVLTVVAHRAVIPHGTIVAHGPVRAVRMPVWPVGPIGPVWPIAEALMIAPEGPVAPLVIPVFAHIATAAFEPAALRLALRHRLRHGLSPELGDVRLRAVMEGLVQDILVLLVRHVLGAAVAVRLLAMTVHAVAVRGELLAIGHDDAVVVLRMLQIVFCKHVIAGGLGVAGERDVFLRDMRRRPTDFNVGAVRFETARKRILMFPIAVIIIVIPSATAAILLSLPHCLKGSRLAGPIARGPNANSITQ